MTPGPAGAPVRESASAVVKWRGVLGYIVRRLLRAVVTIVLT